jgi:hypothetical protein
MKQHTLSCARAIRDGGIDAIAALDAALPTALAGLSEDQARALKQVFGKIMGDIVFELINPAVQTFPELEPDPATWAEIVRTRALFRSAHAHEAE